MRCFTKITTTLLFVSVAACTGTTADTNSVCDGAKCDTPGNAADTACRKKAEDPSNFEEGETAQQFMQRCRDEAALLHCEARKSDAIDSAQKVFTKDAIRWACSDVDGVNTKGRDDRGQEYCEYFPVIQLPPKAGVLPDPVTPGRLQGQGRPPLPLGVELTEDQIFDLEDNPNAEVGSCVFTSWHQDIDERLPACGDSDVTCPKLDLGEGAALPPWATSSSLGVPLTSNFMKMKVSINSNVAASDLFEKCLTEPPVGDVTNENDPLHDDFMRGCWKSYELFKTEWRRSDPSVCAAGVRLAECGCGVDADGDGIVDITDPVQVSLAVVPRQPTPEGVVELRGFPLGTWSGASNLPVGCEYVETGDTSQTLVRCKITAGDLLANQNDPKEFCRAKYGDDVVVHVPVPAAAIVCNPPEDGTYADCSDMPWVVESGSSLKGGTGGEGGGGDNTGLPTDCGDFDYTSADESAAEKDTCQCTFDVCEKDAFCCTTDWDSICVGVAQSTDSCG